MRLHSLVLGISIGAGLVACAPLAWAANTAAQAARFNHPGNVLIADQFNNRVIEVNDAGRIVWTFGLGPNDVTASSPVGVNDALRVGKWTLISGTGAPAGTEPKCPSGCADNRVFLVDQNGAIVWQYGTFGVTGSGPNQLNTPVQATWTPHRTVLIADQANQRVIEINRQRQVVWQYGTVGVMGNGVNQLNNPNSAEMLDDGDVLIADEANNRAILVNHNHEIVASYTAGGTLNGVAFASRLRDGHILITDSNNNRVVEVDPQDHIVWSVVTNTQPGSNPNPQPTRAVRLRTGDTLISDQFNHRVIVVNRRGVILRQFGNLNAPGFGPLSAAQGLNGPYDAKVVGDDTGLTAIPERDEPDR
jgi:outer membrane protein assembly factor BamB